MGLRRGPMPPVMSAPWQEAQFGPNSCWPLLGLPGSALPPPVVAAPGEALGEAGTGLVVLPGVGDGDASASATTIVMASVSAGAERAKAPSSSQWRRRARISNHDSRRRSAGKA